MHRFISIPNRTKFTKYLSSHVLDIMPSVVDSKINMTSFLSQRGEPGDQRNFKRNKGKNVLNYDL